MPSPATPVADPRASAAARRFFALWGEIADLEAAGQLLEWDQETHMPPRGQPGHGQLLATLAGLAHRRLTASELRDVLDACAEQAAADSTLAAQVRVARHLVARAVRVPEALTRALAAARSRGTATWQAARKASDFALFAPALDELLRLKREQAAAIGGPGEPYDALLDGFEPGMTAARLRPLFAQLQAALTPLVQAVAARGAVVDESPARGHFPAAAQEAFGRRMARAIGFDFDAGRLDRAAHPFCVGIHHDDVRLTWRWQEDDFRPGLFGILHEAGHGLYEQGLPAAHQRTPIGVAHSLGLHESQSRLWENHVGRSRGFWRWALPQLFAAFPALPRFDLEALWPALHTVKPSLIRVEADEATYNLHVVVRFELEQALFAGDLEAADLPAAWDDRYQRCLGLRADSAADGVLQDIHWSQGMFGYFPTYTLGTMAAAQLFAAAERRLGDLEAAFAEGRFSGLLDWLRSEVHARGSRDPADLVIEQVTGRPLGPDDLLAYLERTTEEAYGAP